MKIVYNWTGTAAVINSLTSGLIYTLGSLLQKQINIDTNLFLLSFGGFGICLGFLFTCFCVSYIEWAAFSRLEFFKSSFNGCIFAGGYCYFYFLAMDHISLGDTVSVTSCSCFIFSVALENFCLRSKPSLLTCVSGLLGCVGLILISQPDILMRPSSETIMGEYTWGVIYSALCGLSGAIYYIILQTMKNIPVVVHSIGYFSGCIVYAIPTLKVSLILLPCKLSLRLLIMVSLYLFIGSVFAAVAGAQRTLPSAALMLKLISILSGYILQFLFLSEPISFFSASGALCICACIVTQSLGLMFKFDSRTRVQTDIMPSLAA